MNKHLRIAGALTIGDWQELKAKLKERPDESLLWREAFTFFEERICSRYLKPIEAIEGLSDMESGAFGGEGFAITAIICSVIEAMETFRTGKVYRKPTKEEALDREREYFNESKSIFISFLTNREPFKHHFSSGDLAVEFYEYVRCPILHEAATRSGWRIQVATTQLIEARNGDVILNRLLFVQAIKDYMQSYRSELLGSRDLQSAFVRKFDSICETA